MKSLVSLEINHPFNWVIFSMSFKIIVAINSSLFDNETYQELLTNEGLNSLQLAKKYGYPLERHRLFTEDGYFIEMHRLPYGIKNTNKSNRLPILIAHGTGGTSAEFLIMGERSVGCRLVDAGFDIWIGNARGTSWSLKHKKFNSRSKEYWNFSWHEIGIYDYTAEIDYIRNITGYDKIFFLGHSQGSTAYLAMAADRPEVNEKIRLAILMGPTAYTKHNMNPVVLAASNNIEFFQGLFDYLHLYSIPSSYFQSSLLRSFCKSPLGFFCSAYLGLTMGYDTENIDERLIPAAITNVPAGLSIGQLVHYAQIYKSRQFQKFDYGCEENLKRYGTEKPPLYNISKITSPVVLMYGRTDGFIVPEDAHDLCKDLPNCVFDYFINETNFNHIAYILGVNVDKFVNNFLIEMYSKY